VAAQDPWSLIHAERSALLADARTVTPEQWQTPSLCPDWTVRQVFAHQTATARMTPARFLTQLAKAGFKFHVMSAKDIASFDSLSTEELLATFEGLADATTSPPGPTEAMVGEAVVHGEDFRRPLGLHRDYPIETLTRAADFYQSSNLLIGAKKRVGGLTLTATDADWTRGSGPEVRGPLLSLVLAITGRRDALNDLSGDGLDTLRARN
jgi:uncharacterized protein (TIGR03083 family)